MIGWLEGLWAVFRRELLSLFVTPVAYVVGCLFLLNQGWNFSLLLEVLNDPLAAPGPVMQVFFGGSFFLFWLPVIGLCATLSMRILAEERRTGTLEALLCSPLDPVQIVLGKYFGVLAFYTGLWLPTFSFYLLLCSATGWGPAVRPDLGPIAAGYLGTFLVGASFLAVGTLASAASRSQLAAAIASSVSISIFVLAGLLVDLVQSPGLLEVLQWVNLLAMMREFSQGVVDTHWIWLHIAIAGGALSSAVLATNSRRDLQSWIQSFAVTIAVVCLCIVAGRHSMRSDWTRGEIYSLSERGAAILSSLRRPVEVVVAVPSALGDGRVNPLRGELHEILKRMTQVNHQLRVRLVDPDRDRQLTERLVDDFAVDSRELADGVVLIRSGQGSNLRRAHIYPRALATYETGQGAQMNGPRISSFRGEEALLRAFVEVTNEHRTRLCYTQGHGEPAFDSLEPFRGYANLKDLIVKAGFEVVQADLTQAAGLDGCEILMIAGPDLAFDSHEVKKIGDFAQQGGELVVFSGAVVLRGRTELAQTGLEDLIGGYGIVYGNRVVVDEHKMAAETPYLAFTLTQGWADHRVTRSLIGQPVSMQFVRELAVQDGATALLTSTEQSWAESSLRQIAELEHLRFDEGRDSKGPLPVVAAAEKGSSRIVVVASDQFALNARLREDVAYDHGRDLIVNSLGWLAQNDALAGVSPKSREHIKLVLLPEQLKKMTLFSLLGLPLFAVGLGTIVLWRRRR